MSARPRNPIWSSGWRGTRAPAISRRGRSLFPSDRGAGEPVRRTVIAVAALPVFLALATAPSATAAPALSGNTVEYNVLAADGVSADATAQAIKAAGGTVVK